MNADGNDIAQLQDGESVIFHYNRSSRKAARRSAGSDTTSFTVMKVQEVSSAAMRRSKSAVKTDGVTFELYYIDQSGEEKPVSSMSVSGGARKAARKMASTSSVTLKKVLENGGTYTWENLPKYDAGDNEIQYTAHEVGEEKIGYTSTSSVASINGVAGMRAINTKPKTISIQVYKQWLGDPGESATVHLRANGTEVSSATLTADNNWTYTFTNLAQADSNGNDITYTLTEDDISGYTSGIEGNATDGFIVTNIKTINIPVTKKWVGDPGESATVHLLANGTEVSSATLNEDNNWTYTFKDLAESDSNGEIEYMLTEDTVDGYESSITGNSSDGFTVTNTKTISIPVTKKWVGDPGESATVHLRANGTEVSSATLNEDNNWTYTFKDLAQADSNGNDITYTLTEDDISGYTSGIEGNATDGFIVTNTKTISIPVTKKWVGDPGESATVHLLANGTEVDSTTLTADNNWTYTFTDLAQADSNGKIEYTLTEDTIDGYISSIEGDATKGFTVTNKYQKPAEPVTPIKPITVDDPPVEKVIAGDDPVKAETFAFTMTADPESSSLPADMEEDSMPMPVEANGSQTLTKTIEGEGTIEFGQLTFNEEGTYVYKVSEVNGKADGYTYDGTVYTVTYVVNTSNGKLISTRMIQKDDGTVDSTLTKLTFTNKYQKSGSVGEGNAKSSDASGIKSVLIKTGDNTPVALWIAMICIAGVVCVALIGSYIRRNRKKEK